MDREQRDLSAPDVVRSASVRSALCSRNSCERSLAVAIELLRERDELVDVAQRIHRRVARRALLPPVADTPVARGSPRSTRRDRGRRNARELVEQVGEALERLDGLPRHVGPVAPRDDLAQRARRARARRLDERVLRLLADAARRHVDHAQERERVERVGEQAGGRPTRSFTSVRQEEARASDDAVGDAAAEQLALERQRERVDRGT